MRGGLTPTRVFIGGTLGVAAGLALLTLDTPGSTFLTELGLLTATPAAALIMFGGEAVTGGVRRLAGAYLWLLFFAPFITVGLLLVLGADPLSILIGAVMVFSAQLVLAVVVALALAGHAALRRRTRQASV